MDCRWYYVKILELVCWNFFLLASKSFTYYVINVYVPRVRANADQVLTTPLRVCRDPKMCWRNMWTAPYTLHPAPDVVTGCPTPCPPQVARWIIYRKVECSSYTPARGSLGPSTCVTQPSLQKCVIRHGSSWQNIIVMLYKTRKTNVLLIVSRFHSHLSLTKNNDAVFLHAITSRVCPLSMSFLFFHFGALYHSK